MYYRRMPQFSVGFHSAILLFELTPFNSPGVHGMWFELGFQFRLILEQTTTTSSTKHFKAKKQGVWVTRQGCPCFSCAGKSGWQDQKTVMGCHFQRLQTLSLEYTSKVCVCVSCYVLFIGKKKPLPFWEQQNPHPKLKKRWRFTYILVRY